MDTLADNVAAGRRAASLVGWLTTEAPQLEMTALVDALCWRLRSAGLPIDRFMLSIRLLSARHLAAGITWRPGRPIRFTTYDWEERDLGLYDRSPLRIVHETGDWLQLDLAHTPDDRFGVVPDLKAEGYAHYAVAPIRFPTGEDNALTLATRDPAGFSTQHLGVVRELLPTLTLTLALKTLERSLREVLATYVGREPARHIIAGTTHRGEVTKLRAAISVTDLRGFTAMSTQMPPEETAHAINRYFDVVVPPIVEQGGEVLKYIGDAVLAIFPEGPDGPWGACRRAIAAAEKALATEIAPQMFDGQAYPLRFGVGMHFGEAVFGNVGSGDRLDFTVIGRDVNVAARISALNSLLGRPFLVSEPVRRAGETMGRRFTPQGAHMVRGMELPLAVYEPIARASDEPVPEHFPPVRPDIGPFEI